MAKGKTINNKLPAWLKYFILLIPIAVACCQLRTLDNDFYFLYPTGEYIVKSGFPHTDILSMHGNMKLVVQQWLSSVLFYFTYSTLGKYGVIALLYICYAGICALTYRLTKAITRNELLSAIITCISNVLIFDLFIATRPQIFSYLVLLGSVYLLEKYVMTGKRAFLFAIPILSAALVNLHASMWPMLFVLMLPYIASAIPVNIGPIKLKASCRVLDLMIALAVSGAAGFLNPYGIDNMVYLFTSYGNADFNSYIVEMQPVSYGSIFGKAFLVILVVIGIIVFAKKAREFSVRFFLMFFGTLLLSVMHIKGIPFFMLLGLPSFAFILKDCELNPKITAKLTGRTAILSSLLAVAILAGICSQLFLKADKTLKGAAAYYSQLDAVTEIINKSSEPVILYTNFNDGQYLEFKGYHPYIDGRAEVFLMVNNGDYDYFNEYYDLLKSRTYYRDFVDKYQFNYLIVNKTADRYLYISLLNDPDFEHVYESEATNLFVRKTVQDSV